MNCLDYNEQTMDVTAWMDGGDAPQMTNEAVTYHEVLRAP